MSLFDKLRDVILFVNLTLYNDLLSIVHYQLCNLAFPLPRILYFCKPSSQIQHLHCFVFKLKSFYVICNFQLVICKHEMPFCSLLWLIVDRFCSNCTTTATTSPFARRWNKYHAEGDFVSPSIIYTEITWRTHDD